MPEHAAEEAILCVCTAGRGFVKVRDDVGELSANQAVVWPAGPAHRLWTTDSAMTVLLVHIPGRGDLATPGTESLPQT